MTSIAPVVTLSPRDYDAVLFDLDGVLTKTASVHAAAWKRLFDGFLEQRAADTGEAFVPLTSMPTTGAMSTASRATTVWQPSSRRAGLSCRGAHPKTARHAHGARAGQPEGPVLHATPGAARRRGL